MHSSKFATNCSTSPAVEIDAKGGAVGLLERFVRDHAIS
jgi:hypothetical protein